MMRLTMAMGLSALLLMPTAGFGQLNLGAQGVWGDDSELGIGGRVWLGIPTNDEKLPLATYGEFNYFFPDNLDWWEINANLVYLFPVRNDAIRPYGGAGLNLTNVSVDGVDGSNSEVGLNLLVGANFPIGKVMPYGDARFVIEGGKQFVLTAGVAFNLGPGLQ